MDAGVKKYLGIDWGEKRIGLASGDSENRIAVPFKVVGDVDDIARIVKEENIDVIVLGKPFKMSGVERQVSGDFENFVDLLKKKADIPVELVDERLTSKAADALSRDRKTRASRDAVAAMLILQSYLDRQNPLPSGGAKSASL